MELVDKLLIVPQRENAGARSSNRFTYQQAWAFNYMLDILDSENDFLLFMEFHDDVIVLDKSVNPELIDFYQIKTDDKDSRFITSSFIVKNASKYPQKMSIAQKMIDNYVKFENETRAIHLVSNKSFDFGILSKTTVESKTRNKIILNEINNKEISNIKKGMCQACSKQDECYEKCLNLIYFNVSDLELGTYDDTILGRFINKLSNIGIESTIEKTKIIYNTVMGEIRRINNCEKNAQNVEELMKLKSISKEQFMNWISKLKVDVPDNIWNQIQPLLLADGFTGLETRKIYIQWKKYQIDIMNVEAINLHDLKKRVREEVNQSDINNSKELIDFIYNKISKGTASKVYNREYLYALIIGEIFI